MKMNSSHLPFSQFPDYFRIETVDKITVVANRGESLQLIGLPGSGKSSLLTVLLPQRLKKHQFFHFDLNLLPEKSVFAVLNLMSVSLFGQSPNPDNPQLIIQKINQFLKKQKENSKKIIFVFDDFQTLTDPIFAPLFKTLRSFHFHHRPFLNYIFTLQREIKDYLPFGPLGTHLSENIVYLPPLNEKETLYFLKEQEKNSGSKLTDQERKKTIGNAGGFTRTIKRLAQVRSAGQSLDEVLAKPSSNPHLHYHFEQLLVDLKPEEPTLKNIILGKVSPADEKNLACLRQLCLIDKENQPIHPLFFRYLEQKFGQPENGGQGLTANEHKALKYLCDHEGQICPKEDLITAVWGQSGLNQVADHALDQLLYRLRKKLASAVPPLNLETIRGRGVKLGV